MDRTPAIPASRTRVVTARTLAHLERASSQVIRIPAEEVKRLGRATQGVIVMRLRRDERVSTLARVVEQTEG